MKVIVTGGAGFIGSHLVDQCLARGYEVTVIDNLSVGRRKNLAHQENHPKLHFVEADIADLRALESYFQGIDIVFHLAARADIVPSIQMPRTYFEANVDGTMNIVECVRKFGIKKLVYAASSSCYGIAEQYPTPETAPIKPEYPYALTKYLGECLVLHWSKVYQIPAVCLRFFNVYGPRARTSGTYGAVFGVFLAQKIHGKPLTVVGDGAQTRDFTYVSDAVSALLAAADSDKSGEIYNVGSGGHYSVNSIVKLFESPAIYIPKRPGEPDCTFADISKIKRELQWKPQVKFQDGVKELLKHIDLWKDAPVWDPTSIANATKDWFKYLGADENELSS